MRRLALALLCCACPAWAQEMSVRVGNHPGFGRMVFDVPPGTEFDLVEEASRAIVVFNGAPTVPALAALPRNVLSLDAGPGAATLAFRPGTRVRVSRMGQRVVVDAYDPPAAAPSRQAARRPAPLPARPEAPALAAPASTPPPPPPAEPAVAASAVVAPVATPSPTVPVQAAPLPEAPASASPPPPPRPAAPGAVLLPVAADVGAAAFWRGTLAVVVLDARLDGAAVPQGVAVSNGPDTAVLTAALPPGAAPRLARKAQGWVLTMEAAPPETASAGDTALPGLFNLPAPGRVVTVLDPGTGQQLLVGTSRDAGGSVAAQRTPGHAVLASTLGVVVEPFSDRVRLLPAPGGFRLEPAGTVPPAPPTAVARLFDMPALPVPALLNRLQAQVAAAAAAPPRARGTARWAVAQTMLSLGMAAEAGSVLAALATDDPDMAARPDVRALAAAAAVLGHRFADAAALDDPHLDGAGEAGLWRGIRLAWQGRDADAGAVLPRFLPLVQAYPSALRGRLLPTVLEVAAQHGEGGAKAALATDPTNPALAYARALQAERDGDTEEALKLLDALATSRDLLAQVRAGARAAELRLRTGALTAAQAADALDKQVLAWRGDGRELSVRLRVAELRTAAGLWRPALDGLRDAAGGAEGTDAAAVAQRVEQVFRAMLAPGAPAVAPLDLVTLASEHAPHLPDGPDGVALRLMLAGKLATLDLPARAQAVVRPLMLAAPSGPVRAGLGAVLAQSLMDAGDAPGAGTALAQSEAGGLPLALGEQRGLLLARVQAASGQTPAAITTLAALTTPAADELRARLLDQAGDRAGAYAALAELGRKTLPAAGPLDAAMQDLVLRQASAAVQAGDSRALGSLRQDYLARLQPPRLDLFRVLTAAPLSGDDLPRAGAEITLARAVPRGLQALAPR